MYFIHAEKPLERPTAGVLSQSSRDSKGLPAVAGAVWTMLDHDLGALGFSGFPKRRAKWSSMDWFKGKSTGNPWVFTIRYRASEVVEWDFMVVFHGTPDPTPSGAQKVTAHRVPRRPATGFVLLASTGRCEPGLVGWTLGRWDGRTGLTRWNRWVFRWFFNSYPLVNIQKTMENHHFSWVIPLFQWPFSIAMLVYQRVKKNDAEKITMFGKSR